MDSITQYYESKGSPISPAGALVERQSSQQVDRRFQEKAWAWLIKQPGISVGKHGEGNSLSLTEVEALNEGRHSTENGDQQSREISSGSGFRGKLSVYASEAQIWQAVAGHAPDYDRVPRLDFACLSVIASQGEQGIVQPEVVKITGQDKRSVPSRTNRLAEKGYIQKLPIFAASKRTSLLVLSRYAKSRQSSSAQATTQSAEHAEEIPVDFHGQSKFFPYQKPIRKMIDVLKHENLLMWDDLKKKLV